MREWVFVRRHLKHRTGNQSTFSFGGGDHSGDMICNGLSWKTTVIVLQAWTSEGRVRCETFRVGGSGRECA